MSRHSFDGVATSFALTRSRIRKDQKLVARWTFHNVGPEKTVFRFYEPSVDANLYRNGKQLGIMCPTGDNPVFSVTLAPGESREFTDELFITRCYDLPPGRYSIRFNYALRLLSDQDLKVAYRKKYRDSEYGLVPWDDRDHPFSVIK